MKLCNNSLPIAFRRALTKLVVLLSVCSFWIASPVFSYVFGHSFDSKLDQEYRKESVLVIDASIEVVKKEYLDADGFSIHDKDRISKDVFHLDQDIYNFGGVVNSVRYLAKFKDVKLVSGDAANMEELKWIYENNAVSMCPHFPRDLIQGNRYRFYVKSVYNKRASEVRLLLIPAE